MHKSIPHARGGVSEALHGGKDARKYSPRPWGCFHSVGLSTPLSPVFPTPVGVFPPSKHPVGQGTGIPHARGGVSTLMPFYFNRELYSPRPWGCFRGCLRRPACACVFPTPVGVFLLIRAAIMVLASIPHARGGVSDALSAVSKELTYSPRPWGCFYVEAH